jgi:hypothetical protein
MITVDKFNVRIVRAGDRYGRDNCLTYDKEDQPMVEFYIGDYFVSRYYVATILGTDGYGSGEGGLILDGGDINGTTVSEEDMKTVRNYLKEETSDANHSYYGA